MKELIDIFDEYKTVKYFAKALHQERAELAIMDEGGTTPISKILEVETFTEGVKKGLYIYQLELIQRLRNILDEDEKLLLNHPDLPEYEHEEPTIPADINMGIPKNDFRRHLTEDDGR
ncbi:MAG: hypothetical protein IK115_07825 [Lachnospiraceae bacterium]|nr:hypothetical protein [Lachnospiraceae bacterium]